jgi:hypothetical protein
MNEAEEPGFLARWSRRKAATLRAADPPLPEPTGAAAEPEAPPELPPIDTLTAASDFTVFLARGVASAVQAQALRVAWTSDPAIAEFRGMAEYAWDFNAPGYGALAAGDDVAALLGQIVRSAPQRLLAEMAAVVDAAAAPAQAASDAVPAADPLVSEPPAAPLPPPEPAAVAQREPTPAPALRRHGSAVPI